MKYWRAFMNINIIKEKDKAVELLFSIFKRGSFIPIIGTGFSSGVSTKKGGIIPTVKDYRAHMISLILKETEYSEDEQDEINKKDFFSIAQLYDELNKNYDVIKDEYHKKNFIDAVLDAANKSEKLKQDFLKISWPYIYTLNYDDTIENSSDYSTKILANAEVKDSLFQDYKCVIKLHGDAYDFTYHKNSHFVRGIHQYVKTLKSNLELYNKLRTDYDSQNILFIGCSLNNELDLLAISQEKNVNEQLYSNKIMFATKEPTKLLQKNLNRYSITDIIIITDYDEIYTYILEGWKKFLSTNTTTELFYNYKNFKHNYLSKKESLSFFFNGTSLISYNKNELQIPSYYIHRSIQQSIINKISSSFYGIMTITGSRISGKTYLLASIMQRLKSDNVYFFSSNVSLSDNEFTKSLLIKNRIFIFDTGSYTKEQFEYLIKNNRKMQESNSLFIIAINTSDEELLSIINNYHIKEVLTKQNFINFQVENKLDKNEREQINKLYPQLDLPVIYQKKTFFDYLLTVETRNYLNQERYNFTFQNPTYKLIALLIVLAIKEKIYISEIKLFDFDSEIQYLLQTRPDLLQKEFTFRFERNNFDLSQFKYIVLSSYLLKRMLGNFGRDNNNQKLIFKAYEYIVNKIFQVYANNNPKKIKLIKTYIYFANINNIFMDRFKGNLSLIKGIYDQIHYKLSGEPHFLHQQSKCLINYGTKAKHLSHEDRISCLRTAYNKCNVALSIINNPDTKYFYNEITIANIYHTIAIIYALICELQDYKNNEDNKIAIEQIFVVLTCEGFIPKKNKSNIVEDAITKFINNMLDNNELDKNDKDKISQIEAYHIKNIINTNSFYRTKYSI